MILRTSVELGPGETFPQTADAAAAAILAAVDGDPVADASYVTIVQSAVGTSGATDPTVPLTAGA